MVKEGPPDDHYECGLHAKALDMTVHLGTRYVFVPVATADTPQEALGCFVMRIAFAKKCPLALCTDTP